MYQKLLIDFAQEMHKLQTPELEINWSKILIIDELNIKFLLLSTLSNSNMGNFPNKGRRDHTEWAVEHLVSKLQISKIEIEWIYEMVRTNCYIKDFCLRIGLTDMQKIVCPAKLWVSQNNYDNISVIICHNSSLIK